MKSFCDSSEGKLIYQDDLDKFISLVINTEEKLSDISAFAKEHYDLQAAQIKSILEEQINDIEYSTTGYDIDDEVGDYKASELRILESNIIKADRDYAEFSLTVSFSVEAWHHLTDYDRSIWDSEDKRYMFTAQTSKQILHDITCKAYVWISFEDGLAVNTELVDVNIEDSYIELDPDSGEELASHEHEIFGNYSAPSKGRLS